MQTLIDAVKAGEELSTDQIRVAVNWLANPDMESSKKGQFLEALHNKGETPLEIASFAESLLALAVDPEIDKETLSGPSLDVCGTGGDKLEMFNISTAAMFVLAAGGAVVIKHGNRAITSKCGGADVLEALGVRIEMQPPELKECVKRLGLGFIFAPAYHPAFKAIGPVRRGLADRGIPSVFNLLGPLLNPARPDYQLVGIYSKDLLKPYGETLFHLGRKRAWAIHGSGADELTLAGPAEGVAVEGTKLSALTINPAALGLPHAPVEALKGGEQAENASILLAILDGSEKGPKKQVVALNAAAGLVVAGLTPDLASGMAMATELIESGKALAKLRALQSF